ncbi:glutaredoxin 2 [Acerihabitans sp. TG2]|uniref:glutaredoxin 2 n=1 Tax=Acerihabitans sp. TG2 TaxID=3096008 RepID=UPI002B22A0EC|nr:glutaredoxin 2 [Acerihabitans sp. TG2]MEA9392564.1 glutaredoxin 2 [Acerihabitans sp. TG2]
MKLYIYEHCPFCVKARSIFGLKNVPVGLEVLLNNNEATPISMVGQKMVPILQMEDGSYMPESMDIVHYIDQQYGRPLLTGTHNPAIAEWLAMNHVSAYPLVLPRNANAPFEEFATPAARAYFSIKKQTVNGSFEQHLAHSPTLINQVNQQFRELEPLIEQTHACNGELSDDDIHLFSRLRTLTLVAGLDWPTRVADYRDNLAQLTQVNLLTRMAQ